MDLHISSVPSCGLPVVAFEYCSRTSRRVNRILFRKALGSANSLTIHKSLCYKQDGIFGTHRDEWLYDELFFYLAEARYIAERCRLDYNDSPAA